ncbi:MAG: CoA-binding protein [Candidatus Komeilibacteria bacterium]
MINLAGIKNIAVVGASANPDKFGNKIVANLKARGFNVYPVNPKSEIILGLRTYNGIEELPREVELLDIVTPPLITLKILQAAKELGFNKVWIQPGAESEEVLEYLKKNNFDYIAQACIMV